MGDYEWDAVNPIAGGVVEVGAEVVTDRRDVILCASADPAGGASVTVHLTPAEAELLAERLLVAKSATLMHGS